MVRVDDVLPRDARPALLQAVGEHAAGAPAGGVDELGAGRAAPEHVNPVHVDPAPDRQEHVGAPVGAVGPGRAADASGGGPRRAQHARQRLEAVGALLAQRAHGGGRAGGHRLLQVQDVPRGAHRSALLHLRPESAAARETGARLPDATSPKTSQARVPDVTSSNVRC